MTSKCEEAGKNVGAPFSYGQREEIVGLLLLHPCSMSLGTGWGICGLPNCAVAMIHCTSCCGGLVCVEKSGEEQIVKEKKKIGKGGRELECRPAIGGHETVT